MVPVISAKGSMSLIYKQTWRCFLIVPNNKQGFTIAHALICSNSSLCVLRSLLSHVSLHMQVSLIQSSKIKIGGEQIQLFRVKIKTFFKCQRKRAGFFYLDVNFMPFVVSLFVFIFYCQQGTRFYRQLNREQMLIKRDVVLSVTLKKYHPLFSKCCSPNGLNFLLTHI